MKEEVKDLLLKIEPFAETNSGAIEALIEKLENEKSKTLPEQLQKKLDGVKNTPLEEANLFQLWESIKENQETSDDEKMLDILEAVLSDEELESMTDIDIKDFIKLGRLAKEKVTSFAYLDENMREIYKEVPSQQALEPMPYKKKREVRKIVEKKSEAREDFKKLFKTKPPKDEEGQAQFSEQIKEAIKNIQDEEAERQSEIISKCNLDATGMTKWERELLVTKLIAHSFGNYTPPVGKK